MTLLAKRVVGTMFLLIGVAGVFLPLMPGVIFIIIGSALLGSNHRWVVKVKSLVRERLPRGKPETAPSKDKER